MMINVLLITLLAIILLGCFNNNSDNFTLEAIRGKREKCPEYNPSSEYPETKNEVYNSSMLYKYHMNGMNSNMFNVKYSPKEARDNIKLKNIPNKFNDVASSNEGTPVLNSCKSCENITATNACKANPQLNFEDYCPKLSICKGGAPVMGNSLSYKKADLKSGDVPDPLDKLKTGFQKTEEAKCKKIIDLIKKYPELKDRYIEFSKLYKEIKFNDFNFLYNTNTENTLDFSNINNETIKALTAFLTDPKNILYFDLPSNSNLNEALDKMVVFSKELSQC